MLSFIREKARKFRQTIVTFLAFVFLWIASQLFGIDVTHLAPSIAQQVEGEMLRIEMQGEVILPTDPRHPNFAGGPLAQFPPDAGQ